MREMLPADAIVLRGGSRQWRDDAYALYEGAETMPMLSPGASFTTGDGIKMAMRSALISPAIGTGCTPSPSMHAAKFRVSGAGLSLWYRGRQKRPPFL
jgi:hypothetical protein